MSLCFFPRVWVTLYIWQSSVGRCAELKFSVWVIKFINFIWSSEVKGSEIKDEIKVQVLIESFIFYDVILPLRRRLLFRGSVFKERNVETNKSLVGSRVMTLLSFLSRWISNKDTFNSFWIKFVPICGWSWANIVHPNTFRGKCDYKRDVKTKDFNFLSGVSKRII